MICAWCKTEDGVQLTADEYAATTKRTSNANHGICEKCVGKQRHEHNIYLGERAVDRNLNNHEKRLLKLGGWYACAACDHVHNGVCAKAVATGDIKPKAALGGMAYTHTGMVYTITDQRYPTFNGRTIIQAGRTVFQWA